MKSMPTSLKTKGKSGVQPLLRVKEEEGLTNRKKGGIADGQPK